MYTLNNKPNSTGKFVLYLTERRPDYLVRLSADNHNFFLSFLFTRKLETGSNKFDRGKVIKLSIFKNLFILIYGYLESNYLILKKLEKNSYGKYLMNMVKDI